MFSVVLLWCVVFALSYAADSTVPTDKTKLSPSKLRSKGDEAMLKGDYTEALDLFTQLIDAEPKAANYYKRASVHLRKRDPTKAMLDLDKSIELDPKFAKAITHRAKEATKLGDCEKAKLDWETILQLTPADKTATTELPKMTQCAASVSQARNMMQRNRFQDAKQHITQALSVAHDSPNLLTMRARCHIALGEHHDALTDTRIVLKNDKTHLQALLLRGIAYYQLGEFETAMSHWREGLKLAPEDKELKENYKNLRRLTKAIETGDAAFSAQKYEEALEAFNEGLTVDRSHRGVMYKLYVKQCETLTKMNKGKEAVSSCTNAINLDGGNMDAWLKRGDAHISAAQWQDAINDFTHAAQMPGDQRAAQEGLRRAQLEQKKAERKDYYKILGVEKDADDRTIKKEFRKLALQWHPDKHKESAQEEAEKQFREIAEAYEVLGDPETRGKYDRGEDIKPQPQAGGNPFQHFQNFGFGGQQFHFQFN